MGVEHLADGEPRQDHLRRRLLHRAEQVEGQPEGVEEGQQRQEGLRALVEQMHPG